MKIKYSIRNVRSRQLIAGTMLCVVGGIATRIGLQVLKDGTNDFLYGVGFRVEGK